MYANLKLVECLKCERLFNASIIYPFFCPFCKKKEPIPNKINGLFVTQIHKDKITKRSLPQGTCIYCGNYGDITKDHIIPKSKGGKTCRPCCKRCNGLKANFYLADFLHNIRNNIGNCAFLSNDEKIKIAIGIEKVIALGIEN